jgi:hypothetical protein
VGKLLRNRRVFCRRPDWIAIRCPDPHSQQTRRGRYGAGTAQAGHAFATPNIVHFGAVLLLAGILTAPWQAITPAAVLWGLLGLSGIVYAAVVGSRMRRQAAYKPVFEDWLFHLLLPLAAYATLAVTAFAACSHLRGALFCVGAAALLLLFVGIHNAWDAVTYHIFESKPKP